MHQSLPGIDVPPYRAAAWLCFSAYPLLAYTFPQHYVSAWGSTLSQLGIHHRGLPTIRHDYVATTHDPLCNSRKTTTHYFGSYALAMPLDRENLCHEGHDLANDIRKA